MIEIADALNLVLKHAKPLGVERIPLAESIGRTLAVDLTSDADSPAFDKSMMDGYAVCSSDFFDDANRADVNRADVKSGVKLQVVEEVTAGQTPQVRIEPGTATRIMTGAPIPAGADCVVMIERTELLDESSAQPLVSISDDSIGPGRNILARGTTMKRGETLLRKQSVVAPVHIGVLAETGNAQISVYRQPHVAVMATGDELVEIQQRPETGQIRNSNGPMLEAFVNQTPANCSNLGVGRDNLESLRTKIKQGLDCDVLILSGGVSAGVLDLVPQVLSELGVTEVFHKVKLKPGKPIWFGICQAGEKTRLVFGLPGNPVSSLVCFHLFAEPAIRQLAGLPTERQTDAGTQSTPIAGALTRQHIVRGDRPVYWPSKFSFQGDACHVEPLDWKGSADIRTLAMANCLAAFTDGERTYEEGEVVEIEILGGFQN